MNLILGAALVLLGVGTFYYSLPRGGKPARFVGTQFEGYVVVAMICCFGAGLLLIISSLTTAI